MFASESLDPADERDDDLASRMHPVIRPRDHTQIKGSSLGLAAREATNEVYVTAMEVGGMPVGYGAERFKADDVSQHAGEVVQRLARTQQLHAAVGPTGLSA